MALAAAALLYLVTWLVVAFAGPSEMPMHFGVSGDVDSWGSRSEFLVMSACGVIVAVVLLVLARFASRLPAGIVNTPHRDYWLTPAHREAFDAIVRSMLTGIAALVLVMFAIINIAGMWVRGESWYFPTILVVFVVGLALVVGVPMRRLYRAPRTAG